MSLIKDIYNRWNSELHCFQRLPEQREPKTADLSNTNSNIDCLTRVEWDLLEGYINMLQPLAEATTQLCSIKYPTPSMIVPILYGIKYNKT